MALSNIDKSTLTRLFKMINTDKSDDSLNKCNIKSNNSAYSKLNFIAKQIEYLKQEAIDIIDNYEFTNLINSINCNFRKVPGTYYYLYENKGEKTISLISPHEWTHYDNFIAKIYYDYDYNFYRASLE